MVRYSGKTDSTQKNGIKRAKNFQAIFWHHPAVPRVIFATPFEILVFEAQATVNLGNRIEDLTPSRDGFLADSIPGD
jgi:hypothetical protein